MHLFPSSPRKRASRPTSRKDWIPAPRSPAGTSFAGMTGVALCLLGPALAHAQDSPTIRATPRIVTIQPSAPLAPNQLPGAAIGPSAPDLAPLQQRDLQSYRGSYEDRTRRRPGGAQDTPAPASSGLAPIDQQRLQRFDGALNSDIRRLEMDAARNRLGPVERRSLDEARRDGDRLGSGLGRR